MDTTDESIATAPLPTSKTLRVRKSLIAQLVRFMAINLKMLKIIRKDHR